MASGPITSWQIDGETVETVADFIFLGSKITVDGDCSHEIKRCLLLERKVMTKLDSILKSRDITLSTKVRLVSSVQFSCSVMYNCLRLHELQHARPPCLSPTSGIYPNPCPLSQWCHPTISSSIVPFSSHSQSFPASGSFQMSQLFSSGGQNIGVSASASVLSMNMQGWYPLGWTGWISSQSKGLSRVFSNTTVQKHQFFGAQLSLWSNSHPYMTTGKATALTRRTFIDLLGPSEKSQSYFEVKRLHLQLDFGQFIKNVKSTWSNRSISHCKTIFSYSFNQSNN